MNNDFIMEYQGIDTLKYLIETVESIKKEVVDLKTMAGLRAYTLKEIAAGLGYSINTVRTKPWKMPNYGRPDEGMHPGKWFYNTIVNWYAIPEEERRSKWEAMSSLERRKHLNISR
jgi:hypothetical protein